MLNSAPTRYKELCMLRSDEELSWERVSSDSRWVAIERDFLVQLCKGEEQDEADDFVWTDFIAVAQGSSDEALNVRLAQCLRDSIAHYGLTKESRFRSAIDQLRRLLLPKARPNPKARIAEHYWPRVRFTEGDKRSFLSAFTAAHLDNPSISWVESRRQALKPSDLQSVWDSVIDELSAKESLDSVVDALRALYTQICDAFGILALARIPKPEPLFESRTRDDLLSYVYRSGNPPPHRFGVCQSEGRSRMDGSGAITGGLDESVRGYAHRTSVPNSVREGCAKARRPKGAPNAALVGGIARVG